MKKAGSHTSIPRFRPDKRTPKTAWDPIPLHELSTGSARAVKKSHHKRQRQLDKKLSKLEEGCPAHGLENCFRCSVQAIIFGED